MFGTAGVNGEWQSHGAGATVKGSPMSKVRSRGCASWSSGEETPHVQVQGNPSKMALEQL